MGGAARAAEQRVGRRPDVYLTAAPAAAAGAVVDCNATNRSHPAFNIVTVTSARNIGCRAALRVVNRHRLRRTGWRSSPEAGSRWVRDPDRVTYADRECALRIEYES